MPLPRDRKLARSKGRPWPRLVAVVGLAVFSCTFPDYRFDLVPPETCDNDMQDEGETGVDCGGNCDPCPCQRDEDCLDPDDVCEDGECRGPCENGECPPTCTDKEKNGDETDVDCGGSCDANCAISKKCEVGEDCTEGVCEGKICQPARCDDGVLNGTEPWTDCGGECLVKCQNDEPCFVAEDCESETCVDTEAGDRVCARPFCNNQTRDEDEGETDVDCGGRNTGCARCKVGDMCEEGSDCIEKVCDAEGECAGAECDDEAENGDETDVDCGGPGDCARCGDDEKCDEDSDCKNKICTEGRCQEAACDDQVTNSDESDLDCGGSCPECPVGKRCREDDDCDSRICDSDSDRCVSCDDGTQNGSELGLDCGGPDCELCGPGDICSDDAGCVNYLCNDNDRCVPGLEVDYRCGQCGASANDHIKFFLTLRNLSERAIDVSDVSVRYYFSTDAPEQTLDNFSFECEYDGAFSCGSQGLSEYTPGTQRATHYFDTVIGSKETIAAGGERDVELTIQLNGASVMQGDDYSFGGAFEQDYDRITLHRQGTLIWGVLPE